MKQTNKPCIHTKDEINVPITLSVFRDNVPCMCMKGCAHTVAYHGLFWERLTLFHAKTFVLLVQETWSPNDNDNGASGGGRGGSTGRALALRPNGFHDQRFESCPEHTNKFVRVFPS